jgi:DNA polymerase-3 subunit delta'
VVSRCQLVRFEPLPAATIASHLVAEGVPAERADACARLALGNASRARYLASPEGEELRREVEQLVAASVSGGPDTEAWRPLLARAEIEGAAAEEAVAMDARKRLEMEPKGRERKAIEKDFEESAKRDGRRARRESLELALTLTALTFRDLICIAEEAPEAVLASDRAPALAEQARSRDPRRLREAAERCEDVRQSLELNVTEDLALSALGFRLAALAGAR